MDYKRKFQQILEGKIEVQNVCIFANPQIFDFSPYNASQFEKTEQLFQIFETLTNIEMLNFSQNFCLFTKIQNRFLWSKKNFLLS